jgi:hypothetical protein
MRQFLVMLMLLVMPFRGFIGDGMAYEMLATNQDAASKSQMTSAPHPLTTVERTPCHTDSASGMEETLSQSQCTTCQVCHLSAMLDHLTCARLPLQGSAAPAQSLAFWHSAEPQRQAKPPVL